MQAHYKIALIVSMLAFSLFVSSMEHQEESNDKPSIGALSIKPSSTDALQEEELTIGLIQAIVRRDHISVQLYLEAGRRSKFSYD